MSAVIFIVTIPTADEEDRLKKAYITRKSDKYSENVDSKSQDTLTQSASTKTTAITTTIKVTRSAQSFDSDFRVRELPTTPVTSNVNNTHLQYGTFTKESQVDAIKIRADDVMSSSSGKTPPKNFKYADKEQTDSTRIMRRSWDGLRDILSSTKRKTSKDKKEVCADLNLPTETNMETVLREILKTYQVVNAVWTKDIEGRTHQVIFTIDFNESYEHVLDKFYEFGIGDREGSTISVLNCIASKTYNHKDDVDVQNDDINTQNINAQKQGVWDRFMNTVRSRLNVAQIVRDVRQDASITFDFIILLISAAILASFGLVEDSTIFLASSMLISPLMGPIIAAIFGTVIKDHSLSSLGLKNELLGITLATLVGFLFGMVVCSLDERFGIGEGLTAEMLSRCDLHSLIVGIFTAIPSGAAAAIGILGGNIGSLVGVAISASILPPAVNSGLLWALACIYKFFETDSSRYNNVVKTNIYSNNQAVELAILASISMCLTISNVLCVYIMGILVLKVKEIAPVISRRNREFWKHDIKYARDLCKNGLDSDTVILDEFGNLPKEDQKVLGLNTQFLHNIHLDDARYQNTWSPNCYAFDSINDPTRGNHSTIHRIERLYSHTYTRKQPQHDRRRGFSFTRHPTGSNDVGTTYTLLSENVPRPATMPSNIVNETNANVVTIQANKCLSETTPNLTKSMIEENKRRKFIVTPAVDTCNSSSQETGKADET